MLKFFSVTNDSRLCHRGKKGLISYVHRNGTWKSTKTADETLAKMLQHKWDRQLFYSDNALVDKDKSWQDYKEEYLSLYVKQHPRQTVNTFLSILRKFEETVKHKKLCAVATRDCEEWAAGLYQTLKPSTVRNQIGYMKPFFRKAHQRGYIERDPMCDILRPRYPKAPPKSLSVDEGFSFLEEMRARSFKHLLLGTFAYETGMRVGEIVHQRMEDVNFADRFLTVETHQKECTCYQCAKYPGQGWFGKAGVPRKIPLSEKLLALLLTAAQERPAGCIFEVAEANTSRIFARVFKAIKIPDAHAHTLRHTLATDMERAGVRPGVIRVMLGHANKITTDSYIHSQMEELHEGLRQVQEWRAAQLTKVRQLSVGGVNVIEAAQ